jgi:cell division protease FtsH
VSYTEFKGEVKKQNVTEVFSRCDTIQEALKQAGPLPNQKGRTYRQFKTERPTFAVDDLPAELASG